MVRHADAGEGVGRRRGGEGGLLLRRAVGGGEGWGWLVEVDRGRVLSVGHGEGRDGGGCWRCRGCPTGEAETGITATGT